MNTKFDKIKTALSDLSRTIDESDLRSIKALRDWGGSDVVIAPVSIEIPSGFYPEPRTVVTQFSRELSWLIEGLRDAFSELLDGTSKIEFYGRLASAALAGKRNDDEIYRMLSRKKF